jgi:hypothetical protein
VGKVGREKGRMDAVANQKALLLEVSFVFKWRFLVGRKG